MTNSDPRFSAESAAEAIRHYIRMRDAQPFRGLDDTIHAIHTGTEYAAELRLSDLRSVLSGDAAQGTPDWMTALSECRDFIADLVGGATFGPNSIHIAEELIEQADAALAAQPPAAPVETDEYAGAHEIYCNASRKLPVGCEACSCRAGREIKKLRALQCSSADIGVLATVEEIERIVRIEFHANPVAARHAAERVHRFLDARYSLRAKTLARQTTASGLPHREGQAEECDGGLHTFNEPQAVPVPWESLTSIIRPMIESVCSDGNSDAARLAKDIADRILASLSLSRPQSRSGE